MPVRRGMEMSMGENVVGHHKNPRQRIVIGILQARPGGKNRGLVDPFRSKLGGFVGS